MTRHAAAGVLLAVTSSLLLLGCDKVKGILEKLQSGAKEGTPCKAGAGECNGKDKALICVDGKYVLRKCQGAAGCSTTPAGKNTVNVHCAWGVDQEGETCSADEEDEANCSDDKKAMLVCRDGKLLVDPCRGPKGCTPVGEKINCDVTLARVGDPCKGDGATCSEDKTERLNCKDGKFVSETPCRGPKGCVFVGTQVECDRSFAAAGDVCTDEGSGACSVDKTKFLSCKAGKLVESLSCRGPKKCTATGNKLNCDASVAAVGDPCDQEGAAACSEDAKQMLKCKAGKFGVARPCNCKVEGTSILCR